MNKTINFKVSGRVQGVFFRASTRQEAQKLGLSGWVRNLPDGRVEGIASGPMPALHQFQRWLQKGPQMAQVSNLEVEEVANQNLDGFEVR